MITFTQTDSLVDVKTHIDVYLEYNTTLWDITQNTVSLQTPSFHLT